MNDSMNGHPVEGVCISSLAWRACWMSRWLAAGVTCALLFAPASAAAQSTATLSGTVVDETNAVIPGVSVMVMSLETRLQREATTTAEGAFTMALLPPGRYLVLAERSGFTPVEIPDVVLNVNDRVALRVVLNVAAVGETVSVAGQPSRVSTSAGVGTVVDRQFVENIPLNGRSLQSLLQLVPGVVVTPAVGYQTAHGQFSVNGQRATANYFMVDGVSANTGVRADSGGSPGVPGSGQTAGTTALGSTNSLISLDALQEFRIDTSTFAAEFGRTPGGQISLVSRGGTNRWQGSVSEYFRHDAMNANDWFANSHDQPKPKMRQHLFGGVLGGPLRRDRFFFFASYEGLRLDQPKASVVSVPTPEVRAQAPDVVRPLLDALPLPNGRELQPGLGEFAASYSDRASFDVAALRVDVKVTPTVTGFVRASHAPSSTSRRENSLSTVTHVRLFNDAVTGGLTAVHGSRWTSDVRLNWTRNQGRERSDQDAFGGAIVPNVSDVFMAGRDAASTRYILAGPDHGFAWGIGNQDAQRQLNVVGTVAGMLGAHQVKVGVDYRRLSPRLGGTLTIENVGFTEALEFLDGRASHYQITASDPTPREPIFSNLSLYAQDTWQVGRRLTLTYGLRFERVPPPTEGTGRMPRTLLGIENDVLDNPRVAPERTPLWRDSGHELAPRVGIAYQLSTRTAWETTLRGGIGRFYDLGFGMAANAFADTYPFWATAVAFDVPIPFADSLRIPPAPGTTPPFVWDLMDPNLRMPYTRQWNVAWEQGIGVAQNVTVSYVGAAGRRQLLSRDYSQPVAEWPTTEVLLLVQRNLGESSYRALQAQYQRRLHRGIQAMVSYTLASARDNGSRDSSGFPPTDQPAIGDLQWAPSDYDVRHVLSGALTYELPSLAGPALLRAASMNWGLDLMVRVQSAFPITLAAGPRIAGTVFVQRPDVVSDQPAYVDDPTAPGGRRINRAAFVAPPDLTRQGTAPRNGLRGFGASQVDLALRREFDLTQRVRLQLRAEVFNLFNRPNFGPLQTTLTNPLFGQPTQTLDQSLGGLSALYQMGGPRSGQLAVKVLF